jgi:hypothetical protein
VKRKDGDLHLRLKIHDPVNRDPRPGVFPHPPHAVHLLAAAARRNHLDDKKKVGCVLRPGLPADCSTCDIAGHDDHVRLADSCSLQRKHRNGVPRPDTLARKPIAAAGRPSTSLPEPDPNQIGSVITSFYRG